MQLGEVMQRFGTDWVGVVQCDVSERKRRVSRFCLLGSSKRFGSSVRAPKVPMVQTVLCSSEHDNPAAEQEQLTARLYYSGSAHDTNLMREKSC